MSSAVTPFVSCSSRGGVDPRHGPLDRAAQPAAGVVLLRRRERQQRALVEEVGVRPVAGQVARGHEVLDRLGIKEGARQVGVLPQQAQQAAVAGALGAGPQGQARRRQVRPLPQRRLERELEALLRDLLPLDVVARGERLACQGEADELVEVAGLPHELREGSSHVPAAPRQRQQPPDEGPQRARPRA